MRACKIWILAVAVSSLSGCAFSPSSLVGPRPDSAQTAGPMAPAVPSRWHAAVPAAIDPAAAGLPPARPGAAVAVRHPLWWARFGDPVLEGLIAAAQAASPDLSSAGARVAQARSQRVMARADLWPSVQARAGLGRGRAEPGQALATTASGSLQTAWEIDLFGARRAASQAAQARLDGAGATQDAVRIAVAAEAALSYVQFRACQAQADLALMDSRSREETARLTALAATSGLRARADAALAQAGAAQGRALTVQQQAQCDRLLKALVALTAMDEPALLQQRPDLSAAAAEVDATGAELAQRQAQRWPQMAVQGQIGLARASGVDFTRDGSVWSLGPLSVTIPVFDGGRRDAAQRAAAAAYDDASTRYRAALRQAVREVEEALVRVEAARSREADTRQAAQSLAEVLRGTQERWTAGLASQFELEDARRSALAARAALVDLEREQVESAIALYRALGGGWKDAAPSSPS